jgi:hypothetical protein
MSENFPDEAFNPVANHGTANLFAYSNSEACLHKIITLPDNKETLDGKRVGRAEKPDKVSSLPQSN